MSITSKTVITDGSETRATELEQAMRQVAEGTATLSDILHTLETRLEMVLRPAQESDFSGVKNEVATASAPVLDYLGEQLRNLNTMRSQVSDILDRLCM